jgi:hypothetical protein
MEGRHHFYGGSPVPSVSDVLDHVAPTSGFAKTDFGSYIHRVTLLDDQGVLDVAREREVVQRFVAAWRNAKVYLKLSWLKHAHAEEHLYAWPSACFGGYLFTPDRVYVQPHQAGQTTTVVDLKTGKENRWRDTMQMMAFRAGLRDMYDGSIQLINVYLRDDTSFDIRRRAWSPTLFSAFNAGLKIWYIKKSELG